MNPNCRGEPLGHRATSSLSSFSAHLMAHPPSCLLFISVFPDLLFLTAYHSLRSSRISNTTVGAFYFNMWELTFKLNSNCFVIQLMWFRASRVLLCNCIKSCFCMIISAAIAVQFGISMRCRWRKYCNTNLTKFKTLGFVAIDMSEMSATETSWNPCGSFESHL